MIATVVSGEGWKIDGIDVMIEWQTITIEVDEDRGFKIDSEMRRELANRLIAVIKEFESKCTEGDNYAS